MHSIDLLIVIAYFVALAAISIRSRKSRLLEDHTVASRDLPAGIVFATLCATYIGPAFTLGLAGKGFEAGYVWLLIFSGFSIQTLLIGFFVAPRLHSFKKCHSVGQVMGELYGKQAQLLTGLLSLLYCSCVVGLIAKAMGAVVESFTGIAASTIIIWITLPVTFHAAWGGMKTIVLTDNIQFILLAIAVPLVLYYSGYTFQFEQLASQIPAQFLTWHGGYSLLTMSALFLSFLLGEALVPPYCSRALAARDAGQARLGFVMAGIFGLAYFAVVVTIGVVGRVSLSDASADSVFLEVIKHSLPVGMVGILLSGLVGIMISTQDSFMHSASVAFSIDLYQGFNSTADPRRQLWYSRVVTGLIGLGAIIFALRVPSMIDALLVVYTLWAPTVVAPLVIGLLWRRAHPASGLLAMLSGAVVTAIWEWGLGNPSGIPSLVPGLIANQAAFWVTHLVLRTRGGTYVWES